MRSEGEQAIQELVQSMESTRYAFAVFETEAARDAAVEVLKKKGGAEYQGSRLKMRRVDAEPDTVRWRDFNKVKDQIFKRTIVGSLIVCSALAMWTVLVFVPNAMYQLSYSSNAKDEDSQPSGSSSYLMMVVVIAGNQLMYLLCASVTEWVGFHFEDDREAAYMVMYTFAIMTNVIMDMFVTYTVAYRLEVAIHAHTYGGKLVNELRSFQDVFASFPMQKALGVGLWQYCFPATFLGGYVAEAFIVIVPYHFQRLILQSHAGVGGLRAERSMASWAVMDMGRYADVLVNLLLMALVFFVPGGYYLQTMVALIGSHLYIYLYDHYRILRITPGFCYAGRTIDNCAQRMLALPLGIILACLVDKANTARCNEGKFCVRGEILFLLCVDVFFLHLALHWSFLGWVVPRLGAKGHKRSELTFDQLAGDVPATWFSTNPVHCLRSGSFYQHSPPCSFYVRGKEHLMRPSPKANSHFCDRAAEPEAY